MANVEQYNPTAWAPANNAPKEVQVPSGQTCLIRKLKMEDIVRLGLVDEMDFFSNEFGNDAPEDTTDEQAEATMIDLMKDDSKFKRVMKTIDAVLVDAIVAPKIWRDPKDESKRQDDRVYISYIDMSDKMALFPFAFSGFSGIQPFRLESEAGVGDVAEGESTEDNSE